MFLIWEFNGKDEVWFMLSTLPRCFSDVLFQVPLASCVFQVAPRAWGSYFWPSILKKLSKYFRFQLVSKAKVPASACLIPNVSEIDYSRGALSEENSGAEDLKSALKILLLKVSLKSFGLAWRNIFVCNPDFVLIVF